METKKPDFVYVTYIATTPEEAWEAITKVDLMRQWWLDPKAGCSRANVSDWAVGSAWTHQRMDGSDIVDIVGKVIENSPPNRLVFTWARPHEDADVSKHSRVTLEIETYSPGLVRLTVIHDELDDSMRKGISGGWPTVLSNLKTFLETGKPLPYTPAQH